MDHPLNGGALQSRFSGVVEPQQPQRGMQRPSVWVMAHPGAFAMFSTIGSTRPKLLLALKPLLGEIQPTVTGSHHYQMANEFRERSWIPGCSRRDW